MSTCNYMCCTSSYDTKSSFSLPCLGTGGAYGRWFCGIEGKVFILIPSFIFDGCLVFGSVVCKDCLAIEL